jgi:hypothetical protein
MSGLERVAHMAFLCVSLTAVVLVMETRARNSLACEAPKPKQDVVGRRVALGNVDWKKASVTVVLQLSPTCHSCDESMPFYRRLSASRQLGRYALAVVVATGGRMNSMGDKLVRNGVVVDELLEAQSTVLASGFTPTLYMVDSQGIVRGRYIGRLDANREREVMSALAELQLPRKRYSARP